MHVSFPLGRQQHTKHKYFTTELIKAVTEMLEYLSLEADLKNGYHLADILTKTCFVLGNDDIFKQFVDGTQNYLDTKLHTDTISDITKASETRSKQLFNTISIKQLEITTHNQHQTTGLSQHNHIHFSVGQET